MRCAHARRVQRRNEGLGTQQRHRPRRDRNVPRLNGAETAHSAVTTRNPVSPALSPLSFRTRTCFESDLKLIRGGKSSCHPRYPLENGRR